MDRMIAYCGLVCSECKAYIATQARDWPALEKMAEQARKEFGQPDATAESVLCDGCRGDGEHKGGYCAVCEVRACAIARGLANCAHCDDYVCDKLEGFFGMVPAARDTLDEIRASL